ncbi:Tim44/TimA family putative adaptor protein, partial [Rhizobiaceae sp. 2RAB30]
MNQAADTVTSQSAVIMLTVYWVFLIAWDLMFPPRVSGNTGRSATVHTGRVPQVPASTQTVSLLRRNDPTFDEAAFLDHACLCYQIVVEAYAEGDTEILDPLVGQEVYDVFARAAAARRADDVTLEIAVVTMREAEIIHAEVRADAIEIAVRFETELISVTRSNDGQVVAGDPRHIALTADLWTFARPAADTSAWRLVATEP